MPTGYTSDVGRKNVSFRKYALHCARAFGALVRMREEPDSARIPKEFKPDDYHLRQLEDAKYVLRGAQMLSEREASIDAEREYDKALQDCSNHLNSAIATKKRYVDMINKAKKWKVPSSEHTGLKDFMISQLEESIKFDYPRHIEAIERKEPQEYIDAVIKEAQRDIEYHIKEHKKEVKNAKDRTRWVRQLMKSLPKK